MSKVSNWWYLVPILFSLIGGIIAFFAIRKRDSDKAVKMIIVGIIMIVIQIILQLSILIIPWTFFN